MQNFFTTGKHSLENMKYEYETLFIGNMKPSLSESVFYIRLNTASRSFTESSPTYAYLH